MGYNKKRIQHFPIAANLKNKRVLVVGGGEVATRKVQGLLNFATKVHVISPSATALLEEIAIDKKISWEKRTVQEEDIKDAQLVISATDDPEVNKRVSSWARKKNILVNVVDRPEISDFISPAIASFDEAMIAVYTDGKDPVLSRDLKNYLKERWDDFLSYRGQL